jgi:hypothetical protein
MKDNEIGGACGTYGAEEKSVQDFWWANLKENDYLGDLDVGDRIILKLSLIE